MTAPASTAEIPAPAAPQPRRRWRQFSLRTLLVAMLVLGVLFGLFGIRLQRARRQAAAVATIRGLGGEVYYDFEIRPANKSGVAPQSLVSAWLLARLGPDFFHNVGDVTLGPAGLPTQPENVNRCWAAISQLRNLEHIQAYGEWINVNAMETVSRQTQLRLLLLRQGMLTDDDFAPLAKLKNLESLDLMETTLGDEGAKYLSDFPKLERLTLKGTRIGDEGVARIVGNKSVRWLNLDGTRVGDRGATEIARLQSLKRLILGNTRITDIGVSRLATLRELEWLNLNQTRVTGIGFEDFSPDSQLTRVGMLGCPFSDEGVIVVARLPRLRDLFLGVSFESTVTMKSLGQIKWPDSLEDIRLNGSGLTDEGLMRFVDCPKLRQIGINGTQVTPEGAARFRTARPTVNVVGP